MEGISGYVVPTGGTYNIEAILELSKNNAISSANLVKKAIEHDAVLAEHDTTLADHGVMLERLDARIEAHEQNVTLTSDHRKSIARAVSSHVSKMLRLKKERGKLTPESKKLRKVYGGLAYARVYGGLKEKFKVSEYAEIREVDYLDAMKFIETFIPDGGMDALRSEAEENWAVNHPEVSVDEYLGRLIG